jgi:hypothetical protein
MRRMRLGGCVVLLLFAANVGWAKQHKAGNNAPPVPEQRISLDALGLEGTPTLGLLRTRAAIATLDFADNDHVLLTFVIRPLLARTDKDDAPAPESASRPREDRVIHAELVDLRTGKLDVQQDWRLYDSDWYVLPLGSGEFLLRRGGRLALLDAQLQSRQFADAPQAIVYGQASGNVLVVELEHEAHTPEQHAQMVHDAKLFDAHPPVEEAMAYAWRLPLALPTREPLFHTLLPSAQRLAVNQEGLLGIDGHDGRFQLFFEPFAAPQKERKQVYKIRSDCRPSARFLREDVALISSCKGSQPWELAINLDGKLLWQHRSEAGAWPEYSTSEDGRRFAVQSLGTSAQAPDSMPSSEDDLQRGVVQVLDVDTGARVFSTVLEPLYAPDRTAALSPDGMKLAMLRKGALEIYTLPPVQPPSEPKGAEKKK